MFFDRLKSLCVKKGIDVTPFITNLGYSSGNISKWRNGTIPNGQVVSDVAKALNVSTDYLLELTDNPDRISAQMRLLDVSEQELIDGIRAADPTIRGSIYKMAAAVLTSPPIHATPANVRPFLPPKDEPVNHATPRAKPTKPKRYMKRVEGNAAAGIPITAVPEDDLHISVPAKYLDDRYFIVRAVGDSMIGANIDSGDYCVFDRDAYRDEGRIMLVQVDALDQPEDTIKRVYFDGAQIELRSANLAYDPMFFPADEVQITGVLVDVLAPDD